MRSRRLLVLFLVCAGVLLGGMITVWLDNPTVQVSADDADAQRRDVDVKCSIAPWDAAFTGNDDGPGGEHSREYHDEVASDCYAANRARFHGGVLFGALGLASLASAVWLTRRTHGRRRT